MIVKCKAQNPGTCRYHNPDAGSIASKNLVAAKAKLDNATTVVEKEAAKSEFLDAQDVYDATDEGFKVLRSLTMVAQGNGDWQTVVGLNARRLKAKIVRAEEKQTGSASETIFYTESFASDKLNHLTRLVGQADSDRFLDIYDRNVSGLTKAMKVDNDSYAFVKQYNALVEDLAAEGNEVTWLDVNRGRNWVSEVRKLKITGKVQRTVFELDNPYASVTFDA